jgi:hypothetical protein
VRHRYPFEALQWLRHQRLDREASMLSDHIQRTQRARAEELRARATREQAQRQIQESSRAEQARLDEGVVRAGDLARAGDWRKGADTALQAHAARERHASDAVHSEVAAEGLARRALGVASNQADSIDVHRLEWSREREAARERGEEEAALEQWTAKRYPPRGR